MECTSRPEKNSYNLAALIPIVGDRMVKIGRMGSVNVDASRGSSEYMPATLEEFMKNKETGKWEHDFIAKYMDAVSPDVAKAYYASRYGDKDMRNDLRSIKAALKSTRTWYQ